MLLLGAGADRLMEGDIRDSVLKYPLLQAVGAIALHDYGSEEKGVFIKVVLRQLPHFNEAVATLQQLKVRFKEELHLETTVYWDAVPRCKLGADAATNTEVRA